MTMPVFNDKPFYQVNREERAYCALFAHALLVSSTARSKFAELAAGQLGVRLNSDHLEVYVEISALRDYWNDLGDPRVYAAETREKRSHALKAMLKYMDIPWDLVNRHDFFWTKGVGTKLWNPGRWRLSKLPEGALDQETLRRLWHLRWAFKAKPDLVIISDTASLLIEAKIESGEGKHGDEGETQGDTRERIAGLLNDLVPAFRRSPVRPATLKLRRPADFTWTEVAECCNNDDVDDFTQKCFRALRRYEQSAVEQPQAKAGVIAGVPNFDGILTWDEILEKCVAHPEIHVGHIGGEADLRRRSRDYLTGKLWKWRNPSRNGGRVVAANWIPASRFLEHVGPG